MIWRAVAVWVRLLPLSPALPRQGGGGYDSRRSRFVWLLAIVAVVAGCARGASVQTAPAPAPAASPTVDEAAARRQAQTTQTVGERNASAAATTTAQVADRLGAIQTRAAAATMEVASTPPFGLVGSQAQGCLGRRILIDLEVEEAEVYDHPDGGLAVVAVVRATNRGNEGSDLFTALKLQDGRGRLYDYKLADRAIYLYEFQQKYGARDIREYIQPGLSARQIWGYVVPRDVWALRIVPDKQYACQQQSISVVTTTPLRFPTIALPAPL